MTILETKINLDQHNLEGFRKSKSGSKTFLRKIMKTPILCKA